MTDAIRQFPRKKARTLRFSCGAPRSARVIADGSRALFLRSDGSEDTVTSLWMSVIDENGNASEMLLADPRTLLADADAEDVPAEERARRERAREGGSGIVGYSTDVSGNRVTFTINGQLFLTDIAAGVTRAIAIEEDELKPVLNPRISPDGQHVMYTTGTYLVNVDLADTAFDTASGDDDCEIGDAISVVASIPQDGEWKIGLAEFAAGEEMDRYDGFWWSPDSKYVLFETYDESPEPIWHLSDLANPANPARSNRYPQALTANANVRLTLLELGFDSDNCCYGAIANEVQWDHETYEYLAAVSWTSGHEPIILVQDRRQQHDQVLAIHVGEPIATMRDAENGFTDDEGDQVETFSIAIPEYAEGERPGSTRVLEEHSNAYWLDLIHGTPAFTPNGRLICAMNDMDADTNRLTANGVPFTPAGLQVREVIDVTDDDVLCVVQRTPELLPDDSLPFLWQSNAADHDARSFDVVSIRYDGTWEPLTYAPGQWTMSRAGNGCVVTGRGMDDATVQMQHCMNIATTDENGTDVASMVVSPIENHAETPGFTPNVHFTRLGERGLYTAIVLPSASSEYAHADTLPVLMKPYGGPGFQQVVENQSFYWDAQWWADQGYIVVTADGRGTTGRGPKWDRAIYETMKSVTLEDQVDAVRALPEALATLAVQENKESSETTIPQPDLNRVAMIGWSYGGFLSALAVLEAPETFAAACAGAPPTDWTLYDTHYTERYLGLDPAVYERNSIISDAPQLDRPLMLIHGFADDNVTIAHSLRLSQALMAAGRKHTFLPLTGITHMTNDETVAENLLILQRDFLAEALER
ncbi:S9 family peptidase [Bifidobacterium catenulatum subsp. kashiwanohense]|uniref:S9 family peptidase n=1 Tax=Bifidobacterium catenulatum subsp. kashiwanohense TaxID=630129 RepID=A0AAJ1ULI6_9BIFI|nr:S9 family peptidase [Bifidobacterium catenulatum]MDH7870369.1 S9 family peptidase [Bifidobacterium catenulatum subsp. kashiwanohense]MDH7872297.1 S9 family peptidase [Bifidobacterium catenulatum subsp. kashiwanohense]MDH7881760.1 S9 family peptidase [Bifidobacterium catenulatum subsp. kashiwanohense]MDH7887109.1 S9 family peptidase [Bifidobacterium catenulatum subsp. kashiwanohense]MDH7898689.1 S9 family peptidase [Bifidobacterium catenulatum subsp. kashiwanohense]